MEGALRLLLALGLGAFAWRDALRCRERAIRACRDACRRHDLQLLDETVSVTALRPAWTPAGPRIHRVYQFEVSADGVSREVGTVALTGTRIDGLYVPGIWEGWEDVPPGRRGGH